MNRTAVIAAVGALVIGVLVGFLWWGMPAQRLESRLGEAQRRAETLERQLAEAGEKARASEEQVKGLEARVKEIEADLATEREQRQRLQMIIGRGRK